MLVSVHIPKTGGVTFRSLLKKHFGTKLLYDYQDRPMSDPTFLRNIKACKKAIFLDKDLYSYDCIHGHFMPVKYSFLKNKCFIIWFRHPVERIVSRYFYMKNHSDFSSNQFFKYIKDKNISLEDFCKIKHFHNVYSKYLWGVSITDFGFIGITEDYDNSLKRFCCYFGVNSEFDKVVHKNANDFVKKENNCYNVSDSVLNIIYKNNKKDFLIYDKAVSLC